MVMHVSSGLQNLGSSQKHAVIITTHGILRTFREDIHHVPGTCTPSGTNKVKLLDAALRHSHPHLAFNNALVLRFYVTAVPTSTTQLQLSVSHLQIA